MLIENGFAASSNSDSECINAIAKVIKDATICSLATDQLTNDQRPRYFTRCRGAETCQIWMVVPISCHQRTAHLKKLRIPPDGVFEQAWNFVRFARNLVQDIESSHQDGDRLVPDFLCCVLKVVIVRARQPLMCPNTVDYAAPTLYRQCIRQLRM